MLLERLEKQARVTEPHIIVVSPEAPTSDLNSAFHGIIPAEDHTEDQYRPRTAGRD